MNIYKLLTGEDKLSLQLIPVVHIEKWVDEVMLLINTEGFLKRVRMEPLTWRRFTLVEPLKNYAEIFLQCCYQPCQKCQKKSTDQYVCLLCGRILNLDRSCYDVPKCLTFHANECGNGAACFLSVASRLIIIVLSQLGAIWGHLYFDADGNEVHDFMLVLMIFTF
uniref:E3 ubiquitin-protein ligase n=1 Tax=Elaeophora elaphi TaxID=1147741 RepID=A0A0R3RY75_9BILA